MSAVLFGGDFDIGIGSHQFRIASSDLCKILLSPQLSGIRVTAITLRYSSSDPAGYFLWLTFLVAKAMVHKKQAAQGI